MSPTPTTREDYLHRLADLLPRGEAARVRQDVDALIQERVATELEREPDLSLAEAERRALAVMGSPERLADELVSSPLVIPLSTRRSFLRLLAVVFACHLLLGIVLAVAGAEGSPVPGLLGPLAFEPPAALLLSVLALLLIDVGTLVVLFVAVGYLRPDRPLTLPSLRRPWTRGEALRGLVLLGLLAVLLNLLLAQVFAIRHGAGWETFLAPDLLDLAPYANVVLVLLAVRHGLTLAGRAEGNVGLAADALGSLSGCALLVVAATRSELVRLPLGQRLGREAAEVMEGLIERVFLLLFVAAALLLMVRFVRQALRLARGARA